MQKIGILLSRVRVEEKWLFEAFDKRGAAYAGFAEKRLGGLEPGKWADFIIVDKDPTKVTPQQLAKTVVLETWIAGKREFSEAEQHAN